jgi:hypothetical protein
MNVAKTQPKVEKNVSRETLSNTTWGLVQDVANSEIKQNGKMLYIFRNFLKMYKANNLPIDKYFDETENDKSVEKILFNADKTRKTLIAKDFGKFVNLVLIPSLGQNLLNFQKDFPYEYKALEQVSPTILFGIANIEHLDLDKMLIESENPKIPVEIGLDWGMFKYNHLKDDEKIFKHNLVKRLFSEKEQGKNIYATFRGDKGLLEISKVFFMPKKVESENVKNAEISPFAKTIETLNDSEKGVIGATQTLTQAKPNTPAEKRQINEIDELHELVSKSIELIARTDSKYAQATLIRIYEELVPHLKSKMFEQHLKVFTQKKVEFNPRVNNKLFTIDEGTDLIKYVQNS